MKIIKDILFFLFIISFSFINKVQPLTGSEIIFFELLKGLMTLVLSIFFIIKHIKDLKNSNKNKLNIILGSILLILSFWILSRITLDIINEPKTIILYNCSISNEEENIDFYGNANFYILGTDINEVEYKFALDNEDIKFIDLSKNIKIEYFKNIHRIKNIKTLK